MLRRERSNIGKKIIGYFIGIIMIFSAFGVIFFGFGAGSSGIVKYKGLKFIDKGNFWSVKVNGREVLFTYLPDETDSIGVESLAIEKLKRVVQIDTTSEFNDTLAEPIALAQFQMGTTLFNFNIFVRNGFTSDYLNFPTITCEDATQFVPVIYFKESNATNLHIENNCIMAEAANAADVIRLKDRLVYGILGII
ncbi:hypothetical protein HYW19_00940 [Candidatus Woesearchaeota archaeon]|nr:hypothetical protein [Candidatus Woesearchaeota archaeon]